MTRSESIGAAPRNKLQVWQQRTSRTGIALRHQAISRRELARADIFDYIEVFYNRTRRHSHLGGVSPEAFELASAGGASVSTVAWEVHLERILLRTYEAAPADFESLLAIDGVGPKTLRALALTSELIYGTRASRKDPARYAFAHGGKDGTPFPVDRATYDRTIDVLHRAVNRAHVDRGEKVRAFRRLGEFAS